MTALTANKKLRALHPSKIVIHIILLLCSLIWIYPIVWTIISSFKPQADFFKEQLSLIPSKVTFENYIRVWSKAKYRSVLKSYRRTKNR